MVSNSFFEFFNSLASDVNSSDGFFFFHPTHLQFFAAFLLGNEIFCCPNPSKCFVLQPLFASGAVALPHLAMAERKAKRQKTEKDTKIYVLK